MRPACPRYPRNPLAILPFYNTNMLDPKENSHVVNVTGDLISATPVRQKGDSLLRRRLIGAAVIIGLVLLGLAFPMVI
jgi:hypothetical protein